ncbi:MAG: TPRREGION domain-containing protein [Nitrospira sp.]|nr:MAG: TPRREGION domain-containing protein [Nitrospira sp.]
MTRSRCTTLFTLLISLALSHNTLAVATPYRPSNESQVLEQLRVNAADPTAREIRSLRTRLAAEPHNIALATALATRYIERSRAEGDPRDMGHAQAILSPWWDKPAPPPAILLLRAMIRQHAHQFDAALADLDAALQSQPASAQAWLTKAAILQVQARYDDARRACQPLARVAARHVLLACLGDIAGLTGQAAASQALFHGLLDRPQISGRERLWLSTILAELSARAGNSSSAERYFTAALQAGVRDQYLLGAYADFLLDQGRYRDVLRLLQAETKIDGLLLRLALAEHALGLEAAGDHASLLAARFAAGRERGASAHAREEARFALVLLQDPQQALSLARANWTVQREPADARILLESALATGDPQAAEPVLDWLSRNRIEDQRLRQLAQQLQRHAR